MDFLENLFKDNPSSTLSIIVIIFFILIIITILLAFFYDYKKNKLNEKKITILERAIKDMIEEFRSFELLFSDQKKILQDYKYTLERLEQETSRLADTSDMTGMSKEEIEPIIKFHGK